jgi:predicted DNA-binding transcriptional regulator AlpA
MRAGIGRNSSANSRERRGASGMSPIMTGKRVLRKREVLERLGIRKTTLYESFIKTGRLRFVKIGARAVGVIEDELDVLIEELRRERDRSV